MSIDKDSALITFKSECILYDAKVLDGLQYLESSIRKLNFAHLELCSLRNITESIKESYTTWNDELFSKGTVDCLPNCNLDYFSNVIPDSLAIDKVTADFFNYTHSFFDNYAQFINVTLLGNEALSRDKIDLKTLKNHLTQTILYPDITDKIVGCLTDPQFEFIEDFNNLTKHQSLISPHSELCLNNGDLELTMPGFEKIARNRLRTYSSSDLETKLLDSYEFAREFCITLTNTIYDTLSNTPHLFTRNRIHSVYTHVQMPNKSKGIPAITEISLQVNKPIKQGEPFYILLAKKTAEDISLINCPYRTITLKDINGHVIGMLVADKPVNSYNSKLQLVFTEYRKYTAKIKDYQQQYIEHLSNTETVSLGFGPGEIITIPND